MSDRGIFVPSDLDEMWAHEIKHRADPGIPRTGNVQDPIGCFMSTTERRFSNPGFGKRRLGHCEDEKLAVAAGGGRDDSPKHGFNGVG
jgi:hypothetical protein